MMALSFATTIRFSIATLCLNAAIFGFNQESALAENWAFQRSYFSHHLPPEVAQTVEFPQSRSAYRVAYRPAYPGVSVRSGWRINRIQLRSGSNWDTQYLFEGFIQARPSER